MGMNVLPILTIVVLHLLVQYMHHEFFSSRGFPLARQAWPIRQTLDIPSIQNVTRLNFLLIHYHHGNGASNNSFYFQLRLITRYY